MLGPTSQALDNQATQRYTCAESGGVALTSDRAALLCSSVPAAEHTFLLHGRAHCTRKMTPYAAICRTDGRPYSACYISDWKEGIGRKERQCDINH